MGESIMPFFLNKTVELNIQVNPGDVAAAFTVFSSDEQAEFFNALAANIDITYPYGVGGFCMQMQYVTEDANLSSAARQVMSIIGEYANTATNNAYLDCVKGANNA
jgi:hypothetical protein